MSVTAWLIGIGVWVAVAALLAVAVCRVLARIDRHYPPTPGPDRHNRWES